MIGQNTFLFLFNQNDLIDNSNKNKLVFIFGDTSSPVVPPNCKKPIYIDYESNNINFNCNCDPIDYDSNNVTIKCKTVYICPDVFWKEAEPGSASFNIECENEDLLWKETEPGNVSFNIDCECVEEDEDGGGPSVPILLENIRKYFGFSSSTAFSIDFNNNEFYIGYNSDFSLYVADMRISSNSYFGFSSEYNLTIQKYFSGNSYFGLQSAGSILYDPYNRFFKDDESSKSYFGNALTNIIVFNPYHEFFDNKTRFGESRFGYENKNTQFVYDPYHKFFDNANDSARYYFGYENKINQFIFDPYNELFTLNETGSFSFGYEAKNTQFVYNPYNLLGLTNPFVLGFQSNSVIRYSDDPYITKEDIPFNFGFSSSTDVKLANVYFAINGRSYFGVESNSNVQISVGFISNSYYGYECRLRYITMGQYYATFNSCIAGFGFELHNNMQRPFYIDLSANHCCSITPMQLTRVEMLDEHDIDVRYGLDKGWGIAMTVEFAAEPRLSATMHSGFTSKVEDNSVYLGESYAGFGISIHTRGMYINGGVELGYGNFIIEQNEIKIELSKPLDPAEINYAIYNGFSSITLLGASYALYPYKNYFGQASNFVLTVEEALRSNFYFGYYSRGELNRRATIYPNRNAMGFSARASFYEPPMYAYVGLSMECEAIITENWVEFLEEGELDNNYVIPNKNGDPDLDRPQGESIEGYRYSRVIKGRCW